jgi:chromate reductase, NAD(P)H dehydrogenase (quinone)
MSIAVISTTNRPGNLSLAVATHYHDLLQAAGRQVALWNLQDMPLDAGYANGMGERSPAFQPFQDRLFATPHLVFVVPEYNGSIPGILKVFIDACDYPGSFDKRKVAMVGIASGREGNVRGLVHLRDILTFLDAEVLPEEVYISRIHRKLQEGKLIDAQAEADIAGQAAAFLRWIKA